MNRETKLKKLEEIITGYGQMIVALSGGVDSVFLLLFALKCYKEQGREDSIAALTGVSPQFARDEIELGEAICDRLGVSHKKIDLSHVVNMIKRNPADRCYHCKREIFSILKERAYMVGSVLADGTNASDETDYRPGFRAIQELGIASPLKEAGLTKNEIRESLRELLEEFESCIGDVACDLWKKPAFACLASRIPYGETITEEKLEAIYRGEEYLRGLGFTQLRVRCHEIAGKISGNNSRFMARIELLPEEMDGAYGIEEEKMRAFGFEYVTLDLGGYEMGKMNKSIPEAKSQEGNESLDRLDVKETVQRGSADNIKSQKVMDEIDRFLKETREREYSFEDFVDIIKRLRMPDGCPWDREQTHKSLKKHLVEESNEALEAIDEEDWEHLCEELGDVLLQIVLHAQIAKEAGEFNIGDVVQTVSEKMVRRHPHVFGNIGVSSVDEGLDLWEEIKKREKQ